MFNRKFYFKHTSIFVIDANRIDAIRDYDVDIGLPINNKQQETAIRLSLRSTFSLIHGPPGKINCISLYFVYILLCKYHNTCYLQIKCNKYS